MEDRDFSMLLDKAHAKNQSKKKINNKIMTFICGDIDRSTYKNLCLKYV